MNDRLNQLLRNADRSAPPPTAKSGLADAVRQRRRRQQVRKSAFAMACVAVAVFALGHSLQPKALMPVVVTPQPAPTPVAVPVKVALTADDIDAKVHELTADRLLANESRIRTRSAPPISVNEQRDRAALLLIYEGDGYARGKRATDAIAAYRRAIDLFPQSYWAEVARQRLKEIQT